MNLAAPLTLLLGVAIAFPAAAAYAATNTVPGCTDTNAGRSAGTGAANTPCSRSSTPNANAADGTNTSDGIDAGNRRPTNEQSRTEGRESATSGETGMIANPQPLRGGVIPPPTAFQTNKVIFLGDSVTAGFGYCGTEPGSILSTCLTNQTFSDSWRVVGFTLGTCTPPKESADIDDRCSNNNLNGTPWTAGPWQPSTLANPTPTVAYSYVIAKSQAKGDSASVQNWAVTGSTPRDWDPDGVADDPKGPGPGRFGGLLTDHPNGIAGSYVVMTLGANPLLSYYLRILALKEDGECATKTVSGGTISPYSAQSLSYDADGLGTCFRTEWAKLKQSEHLKNLYESLLAQGNHVLVVGYPTVCPWSFGNWQPVGHALNPSSGSECDLLRDNTKGISQLDQAVWLGAQANGLIRALVEQVRTELNTGNIAFVQPDATLWLQHQAWMKDSWVFKNDTWIHPSWEGHRELANTVLTATCSIFQHWCGSMRVRWSSGVAKCNLGRSSELEPVVGTAPTRACAPPLTVDPCLNGGWQSVARSDGTVFTDEAECQSYGDEGGSISSLPAKVETVAGGNGPGSGPNDVASPQGVALDSNGNLYVVDYGNSRVQKYAPGNKAGVTVARGGGVWMDETRPNKVAVDRRGDLFVVYGYTHGGKPSFVQKFEPGNTTGVTVVTNPVIDSIAVDSGGNLYLGFYTTVEKYAPGSTTGVTVANGVSSPFGIAVDTAGNVFVADINHNRVQKFAPGDTNGVTVAGGNGQGPGPQNTFGIQAVAVDSDGDVFLLDREYNRVQLWEPNADFGIPVAGDEGAGPAMTQLNSPTDMAMDSAGNIYVADTNNNRVQKWSVPADATRNGPLPASTVHIVP